MILKVVPKNDRLKRFCLVDDSSNGRGKQVIADNIRCESHAAELAGNSQYLNTLREAVRKAHEILLHEMDNGRTPSMLQGVGLGYFEDVIAGINRDS